MRRPGVQLSAEILLEEARFILRTLLRDDLFGKKVRLAEAEKVLDAAISLSFSDYAGFLQRNGYVRIDALGQAVEVSESGKEAAEKDDPDLLGKLGRHFAKEIQVPRALPSRELVGSLQKIEGEELLDRRYRRGAEIGSGPLGVVFRGEHLGLGRPVAIKEARQVFQAAAYLRRDEIIDRLAKASRAHAQLAHPGVAELFDRNFEREYPYLVSALCPGGNLRQRLMSADKNRLSLQLAMRILLQIVHALRHAHQKGVLHLGLKPENVLFDELGNVKLTDFGMAAVFERGKDTAPGAMLVSPGTVGYLAPERLQPEATLAAAGPQADIYSAGMLVYEMLTGKLPGRRSPLPSQARKEVPAAFDDVFDRMTRDNEGDRFASMDDVLTALYKALPSKEVFSEGTIVLWAHDPMPPKEKRSEDLATGRLDVASVTSDLDTGRPSRRPAPPSGEA